MKNSTFRKVAHGMTILAFAGLAQLGVAQSNDEPGSGQVSDDPDPMVARTIPQARPGLPVQTPSGAQGPVRSDTGLASDPSIRDTNPLTVNGLWEQRPGNRIVPGSEIVSPWAEGRQPR